jgi:phosphoribosylaminoimidazolecarboxamide formyltransferase/IMP cyclohydrolase
VEEIDIGGPSLLRAAAKNFRDVLVVVEPEDSARVVEALRAEGGPTAAFKFDLARRAFAHTAAYDQMIATTLQSVSVDEVQGGFLREPQATDDVLPGIWQPRLTKIRDLRYGENPHQAGAWYAEGDHGFGGATVHQGKELSFTNLLDLDAAARIALEFDEPCAVVIKHTNPCGVATGATPVPPEPRRVRAVARSGRRRRLRRAHRPRRTSVQNGRAHQRRPERAFLHQHRHRR